MMSDKVSPQRRKKFEAGETVLVVLHSPREKCWGVLDEINPAGVFLRGLDLNAFDDWTRAVLNDEVFIGLTDQFFPMWRIERLSRDESAGGIPSMADQFEARTGRRLDEFV